MTTAYALGTFRDKQGRTWPGIVQDGKVAALADILPDAPKDLASVFSDWRCWDERIAVAVPATVAWQDESELVALLPFRPENLLGAGANYREHVIQLIVDTGNGVEHMNPDERREFATSVMDRRSREGKPFVWIGMRSAIAGPDTPLILPHDMVQPDWELELAVVIGASGRRIPREKALDHVAGYTVANDITARELVWSDTPQLGMDLLACKNAPGFHIIGPYITPARFVADPYELHIKLSVNGELMQDSRTDDMIFDIARMIEHISSYAELQPGDILMTGSPSGNGTHYDRYLQDGDVMEGEILGLIGRQVVRCVKERSSDAA